MKRNTAILLATACTIAWSAATQALPPLEIYGDKKPSIEVDLHALYVLEGTLPPAQQLTTSQHTQIPFQIKSKAEYQDAPSSTGLAIAPEITMQAQATPQTTPTIDTATVNAMPAAAPMVQQAPGRFTSQIVPPRHASKTIIMPPSTPPALPYRAERITPQILEAKKEESWLDESVGLVGGLFASEENTEETTLSAATPPTEAAPLATPQTQPSPNHTLPDITTAKAITPPAAPEPVQNAVQNAARYDGYEIAQSIVEDPQASALVETPSPFPSQQVAPVITPISTPAADPAPRQAIPLPMPTASGDETLLAEINDAPLPDASSRTLTVPKEITEYGQAPTAAPQPSLANEVQQNNQAKIANINVATTAPTTAELPEPIVQTAPQAPVQMAEIEEEKPWYDSLKSELNSYFADEEKAQEESKQTMAQSQDSPITTSLDDAPFLAPAPASKLPSITSTPARTSALPVLPTNGAATSLPAPNRKPIAQAAPTTPVIITKLHPSESAEDQILAEAQAAADVQERLEREADLRAQQQAEIASLKTQEAKQLAEAEAAEAAALAKANKAEEVRKLAEAKEIQEAKKLAEAKAAEEAEKQAQVAAAEKAAEEQRIATAQKAAEAAALAKAKKAEEARTLAEAKAAEEAAQVTATAKAKAAEEAKKADDAKSVAAAPTPKIITIDDDADSVKITDATAPTTFIGSEKVELKRDTQVADEVKEQVENPVAVASLSQPTQSTAALGTTKLGFVGSETGLASTEKQQLNHIATTLKSSDSQRLAIKAYASADEGQEVLARRIALARGLAVRAYLIEQGVNALRINVQSVGNKDGSNTPDEVVLELKSVGGA